MIEERSPENVDSFGKNDNPSVSFADSSLCTREPLGKVPHLKQVDHSPKNQSRTLCGIFQVFFWRGAEDLFFFRKEKSLVAPLQHQPQPQQSGGHGAEGHGCAVADELAEGHLHPVAGKEAHPQDPCKSADGGEVSTQVRSRHRGKQRPCRL